MCKAISSKISVTLTHSLQDSTYMSIHAHVTGFYFNCRIIVLILKTNFTHDTFIEHDEKVNLASLLEIRAAANKITEDYQSGVIEPGFSC